MFKVNNRNTKTMYKVCSKLTIKTPEQLYRYVVLLLTLNKLALLFLSLTLNLLLFITSGMFPKNLENTQKGISKAIMYLFGKLLVGFYLVSTNWFPMI